MSQQVKEITKNYYAELTAIYELPESDTQKLLLGDVQSLLYGFRYEDNKLTYEGSEATEFAGFLLMKICSPASEVQLSIHKNGKAQSIIGGSVQTGNEYKSLNASFEITLEQGDFVEIYSNVEGIKAKELKISISKK